MFREISSKFKVIGREKILISILIIFHVVGLIGLQIPAYRDQFLSLSFANLLLSFSVLLISRKSKRVLFIGFLTICFFTGMVAEWIGIHTGLLFGDYQYGENLGLKIYGVPLIIGVNWGVLSVCSCSIIFFIRVPSWFKAFLSAAIMTLLDFLIEPVAIVSDYWTWNSPEIPFYNYFCWFIISLPLHWIYFKLGLAEKSKTAIALFIILVAFFGILNLAN
jgi:putative membrane protein